MTGAEELDSALRHDGQVLRLSLVVGSTSSKNSIVISLCRENGCVWLDFDAGHVGASLSLPLAGPRLLSFTSGVRDGVQKEGSTALLACKRSGS